MSGGDALLLGVLIVLILSGALLAAAETSLLRVRRSQLAVAAETGDRASRRALGVIDRLPRVLNAVLLAVLLVQIGAATVAGVLAERWFGGPAVTAASVLLSFVLFVYAEAIPKTIAVRHPGAVATRVARIISAIEFAMRPLVRVLVWLADLQAPGRGVVLDDTVSEEELQQLAADAARSGRIEEADARMMQRAFELGDLTVGEVMVPRHQVVGVESDTAAGPALDVALDCRHRCLAVHRGELDHTVGAVTVEALAAEVRNGGTRPVGELVTEVAFVPETKPARDLLEELRDDSAWFAVVVDEHGGVSGIVTVGDLLDELVGELSDPSSDSHPVEQVAVGSWVVSGALRLHEIERETGVELPEGPWTTVAGLVVAELGHLPEQGDAVAVGSTRFEVRAMHGRRITRLQMTSDTARAAAGSHRAGPSTGA